MCILASRHEIRSPLPFPSGCRESPCAACWHNFCGQEHAPRAQQVQLSLLIPTFIIFLSTRCLLEALKYARQADRCTVARQNHIVRSPETVWLFKVANGKASPKPKPPHSNSLILKHGPLGLRHHSLLLSSWAVCATSNQRNMAAHAISISSAKTVHSDSEIWEPRLCMPLHACSWLSTAFQQIHSRL